MKQLVNAVAVMVVLAVPSAASSHAISSDYANAGAGSVTIWRDTYFHSGEPLEGSLDLVGVVGNTFALQTQAFSILTLPGVGNKSTDLVDGVTNSYADRNGLVPNNLPLVGSAFNAGCPQCGPVEQREGVTFTDRHRLGIFELSGVGNQTPEPSTVALLGIGLIGLAATRRRKLN